jgi:hypothetical protein
MFRKTLIALSALTVIAAAALAPTAASAGGGNGGGKHHHGLSFGHSYGGPVYAYSDYGYGSCWAKRWVDTPFGPRLKRFFVCY